MAVLPSSSGRAISGAVVGYVTEICTSYDPQFIIALMHENQQISQLRGTLVSTHVKLDVELVLEEVVHVPALAEPPGAVLVGLQPEPVVVRVLVLAHVLLSTDGLEENARISKAPMRKMSPL